MISRVIEGVVWEVAMRRLRQERLRKRLSDQRQRQHYQRTVQLMARTRNPEPIEDAEWTEAAREQA